MTVDPRLEPATKALAELWYEMHENGFPEGGWMQDLAEAALRGADDIMNRAPTAAEVLHALEDIAYLYRPVSLSVEGTHDTVAVVRTGDYEWKGSTLRDHAETLVEWANRLRFNTNARPKEYQERDWDKPR